MSEVPLSVDWRSQFAEIDPSFRGWSLRFSADAPTHYLQRARVEGGVGIREERVLVRKVLFYDNLFLPQGVLKVDNGKAGLFKSACTMLHFVV